MAPRKTTIDQRVEEFKTEHMYVFDRKNKYMMCQCCNTRVDWEKKSTVINHCSSESHLKSKAKFLKDSTSSKKQANIDSAVQQANKLKADKEEFVKTTVRAFLGSNIPLKKLDDPNIRAWLNQYIKGAGDLPTAQWIRSNVVPKIKSEDEEEWRKLLEDRDIIIHCDESTDRRGRAVFIVLFKILSKQSAAAPKIMVAGVTELETPNAQQCCQNIIQVLNNYKVQYKRVKGIATDSAPYMTACVRTLRGIIGDHLHHIQCWSHKLDKIERIPSDTLYRLNDFIRYTKKGFKNTRKRRSRYLSFLKGKYEQTDPSKVKLFPLPVMNRFNSWALSATYVADFAGDLVQYFKGLTDDVAAVKYFKKIKEEDVAIIKAEAQFVAEHCLTASDLLRIFGGDSYPLAHNIYPKLEELLTGYRLIANSDVSALSSILGEKTTAALQPLPEIKRKNVCERFKKVASRSSERLTSLIASDPAKSLFECAANLFNPMKIMTSTQETTYSGLKILSTIEEMPMADLQVLYGVLKDNVRDKLTSSSTDPKSDVVFEILTGMLASHPKFASACLNLMFFSVSNIDCERAFSHFGDVVSPRRNKMYINNAETVMQLYFGDDPENGDE